VDDPGHTRIPHRELRNNSSGVLRRVQNGEVIEVTNHGDVVAILVPPGAASSRLPLSPPRRATDFLDLVRGLPTTASTESSLEVLNELRGER
jgi:prevent-host-death family protein